METIPNEIVMQQLLYLPYKEIVKKCSISRKFAEICNNEYFWKQYLFNYFNGKLINGLNYRQTVDTYSRTLDLLLNYVPYVSINGFRYFMKKLNEYFRYDNLYPMISNGLGGTIGGLMELIEETGYVFDYEISDQILYQMSTIFGFNYNEEPIEYKKIQFNISNVLKYAIEKRKFYNKKQEIINLEYNRDEVLLYLMDLIELENDHKKKEMIEKIKNKITDIFSLYFKI